MEAAHRPLSDRRRQGMQPCQGSSGPVSPRPVLPEIQGEPSAEENNCRLRVPVVTTRSARAASMRGCER